VTTSLVCNRHTTRMKAAHTVQQSTPTPCVVHDDNALFVGFHTAVCGAGWCALNQEKVN